MAIEDPKATQQASKIIEKVREEMDLGKPTTGSKKESVESAKIKKACEVFNTVLGGWVGNNLDLDKPLDDEEKAVLADKVGLQLSHIAEGAYPLGRDKIQELLPALETLGFTSEEVTEIKLCTDLFVTGRDSKEAWAEYAKKFEKAKDTS